MNRKIILKASRPGMFGPEIELKIGCITQTENGRCLAIAKPLELEVVDTDLTTDHIAPTLRLMPEDVQQFMDELWHIGIRPSEGSGSAGQMAATEKHLNDMRALVFKTRQSQ